VTASPYRGPTGALAAVLGGAVTRERLQRAASSEGRGDSALVHSLLAQSLPSVEDLARAYRDLGGVLRLDPSFLRMAPRSGLLLDPELLRRERCVPVELFPDLCVLAVEATHAAHSVEAIRAALGRDVLPVIADGDAIDAVLAELPPLPRAVKHGPLPRRDAPVHSRFRELVLEDLTPDAIPFAQEAGR